MNSEQEPIGQQILAKTMRIDGIKSAVFPDLGALRPEDEDVDTERLMLAAEKGRVLDEDPTLRAMDPTLRKVSGPSHTSVNKNRAANKRAAASRKRNRRR